MEKFLAGLTNQDSTGILIAKNLTGFSYVNDYLCKAFGYSKDEFLKIGFLGSLMDPNDPEGNIDLYLSVMGQTTQSAKMTHRFIRKDRSLFQANLEITNRKDSDGVSVMLMQFDHIIDSDKTVEETSEGNLASFAENFMTQKDTGVILVTTKENFVYANQECCKALGYTKDELLALKHNELVHPASLMELTKNAIMVFTGLKSKANFPCSFVKKDGSIANATLSILKQKENGVKYMILQLDNITQEAEALAAN